MTARVGLMMQPTSRRSATQRGLLISLAVHAALLLALPLMLRHAPLPVPPETLTEITMLRPRPPQARPKPPAPAPAKPPRATPAPAAAPPAPRAAQSAPAVRAPAIPAAAVPATPKHDGAAGRERARREVAQQVANVSGSVNQVLADLSTSLASTGNLPSSPSSSAGGRRRTLRGGRSEGQLGATAGVVPTGAVDGGGGIDGALIAIESLTQVGGSGSGGVGGGGDGGGRDPDGEVGGTGTGQGSASRSNASLLAVVRRYAPGIQFCYDNELKRNPSLRGKIVLALVVAASGEVTDVQIVEDTLGAAGMRECVLAQVRAWRFPAAAGGSVGFRTPFVFTPPR